VINVLNNSRGRVNGLSQPLDKKKLCFRPQILFFYNLCERARARMHARRGGGPTTLIMRFFFLDKHL